MSYQKKVQMNKKQGYKGHRYEEDLLLQELGKKYMNEVPMFIPGLKRKK